MKPYPYIGIIKDTHLTQNNAETVISIFQQFIELLQKLGVRYAIHLGDFFSERNGGHNTGRLAAVGECIRMFVEAEIKLFVIAGNHDKEDLSEAFSYLNVYNIVSRTEFFELYSDYGYWDFKEIRLRMHFIPYFTEGEEYIERLIAAKPVAVLANGNKMKNVLSTHIAVNGVRNNDGSVVENGIPVGMFTEFDKVLIGHYHDESYIKPNIHYIPGSYQQNFGETEKKGFTILHSDLSTTFHQSEFKKYKQLRVNVNDKASLKEIEQELAKVNMEAYNVRVQLVGNQAELQSADVTNLRELGIDIKKENNTEVSIDFESPEQMQSVQFDNSSFVKYYIEFSKENNLSKEQRTQGLQLLKQLK